MHIFYFWGEAADEEGYYRGAYSTFGRHFDLSEVRRIGFTESVDHVQGYYIAFNRMREGKVIP